MLGTLNPDSRNQSFPASVPAQLLICTLVFSLMMNGVRGQKTSFIKIVEDTEVSPVSGQQIQD